VLFLVFVLNQVAPDYQLPESVAPPMDIKIVPMPEPPPPPVVIERLPPLKPEPPKPQPVKAPAPKPEPPKPEAPAPAPSTPSPPAPAPSPPKPTPTPPKPNPTETLTPKPTPAVTPKPETKPAPPLAPTQPAPPTSSAPPAPPTAIHLNIHKPEKEAPSSVATLPFAPAAGQASAVGAPATPPAGGEPELGGSRLSGLSPYPYGAMPGGGSGLRGTLVGCANADAVSLTAVERARCTERFGAAAGSAPALDSMSAAKRAAFDDAQAREDARERYRAALPTGTTPGKPGFGSGLGPDTPDSVYSRLAH
jgi:hypothetical protein